MSRQKYCVLLLGFGMLLLSMGCSSDNRLYMSHTLAGNPPEQKPTSDVALANISLNLAVNGDPAVLQTVPVPLPDHTWALGVQLSSHTPALALLKKLRLALKRYTYVPMGPKLIGLWLDEPKANHPPVKDPSGNVIDNSITLQDCQDAAHTLGVAQPQAEVTAVTGPMTFRWLRFACFVQAVFPDDASFESFLTWQNPYSLTGDLFHMDIKRSSGVIATVWVRALRAPEILP